MAETKDVGPRENAGPQTIEQAEQEIAAARAQMDAAPRAQMATQAQEDGQPTMAGAAPPPAPQESDCARMCRAFASMQRAQAALCRMAGEHDPRCTEAKKTVAASAQRVAGCGCAP
jgi:hypothetical protein